MVPPLTDHGGLDEAPGVGLRDVRLQHAGGASRLIYAPEHVDLPSAHGGGCRMHGLGQRGHGFPLISDGVVPEERKQSLLKQRLPLKKQIVIGRSHQIRVISLTSAMKLNKITTEASSYNVT